MSYIYKITNNVNGKLYIGKTKRSLSERFKQHVTASRREDIFNRPLYKAFRKHGIENFKIELVEEVVESVECERESFWIEYFSSFKHGYNATLGGDGRCYIDRKLVIETFKELKVVSHVAETLSISRDTVSSILKENKISVPKCGESTARFHEKTLKIFKKDGSFLGVFSNGSEAARWLISHNFVPETSQVKNISARLLAVASGKRKSCYNLICTVLE